jgi:Uma2 family endonuclease
MQTLTQPSALPFETTPPRHHWTVEAFYRAVSAGVFDDPKRWEVIRGELWRRDTVNPPHAYTTERLARAFRCHFEPPHWVREEKPLRLSEDTEPQPDVVVVREDESEYAHHHPTPADTRLVVEVADATRYIDLGEKATLYAEAGIPEYWVVDLPRRLSEDDEVAPLFAPATVFQIADLLPKKEVK